MSNSDEVTAPTPPGTQFGAGHDGEDIELGEQALSAGEYDEGKALLKTDHGIDPEQVVTAVIEFEVPATVPGEHVDEFFEDIDSKMMVFKGFIRKDLVKIAVETGTRHTIIIAFEDYDCLRTWLSSDERKQSLSDAKFDMNNTRVTERAGKDASDVVVVDYKLDEGVRKPKVARPAPKWKLAIVVYCGVLSSVFCIDKAGIGRGIAMSVNSFCVTIFIFVCIVVSLLTFAVLPVATHVVRRWLLAPRPRYTNHLLRVLDEGLDLFVPAPPPVDRAGVDEMLERIGRLEGTVHRLRSRRSTLPARVSVPCIAGATGDALSAHTVKNAKNAHKVVDELKATRVSGHNEMMYPITLVVHHHVKWEFEEEFGEWCVEMQNVMAQFPGFLGMTRLHGKGDGLSYAQEYVNICKFRNLADMEAFAKSQQRREMHERVGPMLESDTQYRFEEDRVVLDAFSELFINPGENAPSRPPPVWKIGFLTMSGLMMCVWPINQNFGPVLQRWGVSQIGAADAILCFCNVVLNIWVCVPLLLFFFGGWLDRPRSPPVKQSCLARFLDRGLPTLIKLGGFDMWTHVIISVLAFGVLIVLIVLDPIPYPPPT